MGQAADPLDGGALGFKAETQVGPPRAAVKERHQPGQFAHFKDEFIRQGSTARATSRGRARRRGAQQRVNQVSDARVEIGQVFARVKDDQGRPARAGP